MPQLDFGHYAHQTFYFFFTVSIIYFYSTFYVLPSISSLIKLSIKKAKQNLKRINLNISILQKNKDELSFYSNQFDKNLTTLEQSKNIKKVNLNFYTKLSKIFISINKI